jgi:hypothetical protein
MFGHFHANHPPSTQTHSRIIGTCFHLVLVEARIVVDSEKITAMRRELQYLMSD